jgi:hypothetical protein
VVGPVALLDATPIPCGTSRQTVNRSRGGRAGRLRLGRQPPPLVLGVKPYVLCTPQGMPVSWCVANPKLGERAVAVELLGVAAAQGLLRPAMVIAADKGLAGRGFQGWVAGLGAVLVRPDRRDAPRRFGNLGGIRQWIESIIDTLKGQLGLEQHGAHTAQGLWVRVAQRLLALAAAVWFNWQLDAPDKRSLVAYDH